MSETAAVGSAGRPQLSVVIAAYNRADSVTQLLRLFAAQTLAASGHIDLVETFAHRLAEACLKDARVTRARVRIEKPLALAPHAVGAGVEIVVSRG